MVRVINGTHVIKIVCTQLLLANFTIESTLEVEGNVTVQTLNTDAHKQNYH